MQKYTKNDTLQQSIRVYKTTTYTSKVIAACNMSIYRFWRSSLDYEVERRDKSKLETNNTQKDDAAR